MNAILTWLASAAVGLMVLFAGVLVVGGLIDSLMGDDD